MVCTVCVVVLVDNCYVFCTIHSLVRRGEYMSRLFNHNAWEPVTSATVFNDQHCFYVAATALSAAMRNGILASSHIAPQQATPCCWRCISFLFYNVTTLVQCSAGDRKRKSRCYDV